LKHKRQKQLKMRMKMVYV